MRGIFLTSADSEGRPISEEAIGSDNDYRRLLATPKYFRILERLRRVRISAIMEYLRKPAAASRPPIAHLIRRNCCPIPPPALTANKPVSERKAGMPSTSRGAPTRKIKMKRMGMREDAAFRSSLPCAREGASPSPGRQRTDTRASEMGGVRLKSSSAFRLARQGPHSQALWTPPALPSTDQYPRRQP